MPAVNPRIDQRVTFALKVLALIALAIYLLVGVLDFFGRVASTGLVLVGAIFFAYLIFPLIHRLNERLPLIASLAIVYVFIALVGTFLGILLIPTLANDVQSLIASFPSLVSTVTNEIANPTNPWFQRIPANWRIDVAQLPQQAGSLIQTYGFDYATKTFSVLLSTFSIVLTLIVVPVLAAYMILDAANIKAAIFGIFPAQRRPKVQAILSDLDNAVGGFIRGQLIDGAIVGSMIAIWLTIMHVRYALLIGVFAGVLNFIPYAGAIIGFIPSFLLAWIYNGFGNAAIVGIGFAVIQQLDGNLIAPRVMKDNVGLSPFWIVLAIFTGSELFGLIGTFLSVPVAAMIRVLWTHFLPPALPTEAVNAGVTPEPLGVTHPEDVS